MALITLTNDRLGDAARIAEVGEDGSWREMTATGVETDAGEGERQDAVVACYLSLGYREVLGY